MTGTRVEPARPSATARAARMSFNLVVMTTAGTVLQLAITAFLGHLGGDALYLRSVYVPFGFVSLAVSEGIAVAAQVWTSTSHRQGDMSRVGAAMVLMTVLSAGGFGVLTLGVLAGSGPLETLLAVPVASRGDVRWFLVTVLAANGLTMVAAVARAVLRGLGRSGMAAVLALADTVLAVGAVLAVHLFAGLGVLSVPVGLTIGAVPMGVVAWLAARRNGVLPAWARPATALAPLRQVALPVAGSFLVLSCASLGYLWLLRDAGMADVAGFGLGQTVQTFLIVPATAIGSAVAITMTLDGDRTDAFRALLRLAVPAYAAIACAVFALRAPLVDVLTSDRAVRQVAVDYLGIVGPSLLALGISLAVLTYLEQAGRAPAAFVLNITFFAAVLAIGAALPNPRHAHALLLLIAAANIAGCGCVLPVGRALSRGRKGTAPCG